jgi:hypothetical protein
MLIIKINLHMTIPDNDSLSIIAKVFYIVTTMGSFVLIAQPIYYVIERTKWYQKIMTPSIDY